MCYLRAGFIIFGVTALQRYISDPVIGARSMGRTSLLPPDLMHSRWSFERTMSCSICGPLFVGDGSRYGEGNVKDLKESGALGCSGCTLIVNAFRATHPTLLEGPDLNKVIHSQLPENPGPLNLYFTDPDDKKRSYLEAKLFVSEGMEIKKWPRIGPGSCVPESTECEESLQQLQKWFEGCRKNHPICDTERRGLPRRVIDIGSSAEFPKNIRLYESHHELKDYACPSYRWPKVPSMRTLRCNIEQYKADIPFETLPLTFQHTLQVAHVLGVQYVWIDAVCIIQDDEDDKHANIAEMDSVYESSALTIMSDWGTDPIQGLFQPRGENYRHERLHVEIEDGVQKTVLARKSSPYHFFDKWCGPFPLFTRAWTYQERILSRRAVHFTY